MGIREEAAARMPHRRWYDKDPTDPLLESSFGRLRLRGFISQAEYEAGKRYADTINGYIDTLSSPESFPQVYEDDSGALRQSDGVGGQKQVLSTNMRHEWRQLIDMHTAELADDICFIRKFRTAQARDVLRKAALASRVRGITPALVIRIVDRVTVYQDLSPIVYEAYHPSLPHTELELIALRIGLRALAGDSTPPRSERRPRPELALAA